MALYSELILPADDLVQSAVRSDVRQVQDRAAAVANEVAVWGEGSVEPLLSLDHPYALDQAPLLEKDQVAVYCPRLRSGCWGLSCL